MLASVGITNPHNRTQDFVTDLKGQETAKDRASAVTNIIHTMKVQREALDAKKNNRNANARKMVGRTSYDLPTPNSLKATYNKT